MRQASLVGLASVLVTGWAYGQIGGFDLSGQGSQTTTGFASVVPILDRDGYAPGDEVRIVLEIRVVAGYHIQAHVPGMEMLIGTKVTLTPTDGLTLGDPRYPKGIPHDWGEMLGTGFEYKGTVRVFVRSRIADDAQPGQLVVAGELLSQACTDTEPRTCDPPATAAFSLRVPIVAAGTPTKPQHDEIFANFPAADPSPTNASAPPPSSGPNPRPPAHAGNELPWEPFSEQRLEDLTARGRTVLIDFTADWCVNCRVNEAFAMNTAKVKSKVTENNVATLKADFTRENPEIAHWLRRLRANSVPLLAVFPGQTPTEVILLRDMFREKTLLRALDQAGPSLDPEPDRPGVTRDTPLSFVEVKYPILVWLGLAFVGGILLNVMPCVLPVVSIKVLSLVQQGGEEPGRVRRLGLVFCLGMLLVFLALATLSAVAGAVWGSFFQDNAFLVGMAALLTAMGLSLFGVFTLAVPRAADNAAAVEREGYLGSLGKGALAVVLGTPCSGPLLGPALGWAAVAGQDQGVHIPYLLFTSIGLGMASPFLLLAWKPAWTRFVPKPGPWMETFKHAMAFILLATAVYIISILPQTWEIWTVTFCLIVAVACWIWGRWININASATRNWGIRLASIGVIVLGAWLCFGYFAADDDERAALIDQQYRSETVSVL